MTLRTRMFLMVWLLVVAGMVTMALLLGRWSITEIDRISIVGDSTSLIAPTADSPTMRVERRITRKLDNAVPAARVLTRRILMAVLIGSIVAALATALLTRQIVGRITALADAVRALRSGRLEQRVVVRGRDELADLAHSFNAMSHDLARSEQQRKQLLSDVSHELRTPLTNVIGAIEAIQDGLRDASPTEMAAMHEEAQLLVRLVDDLRDVALAEAGELTLHRTTIDAADLARRAAAAFPATTDRAGIVVEAGAAGLQVVADPRRMAQVLRNLLDNARVHGAPGSTITLRVQHQQDHAVFEVHNRGAPIPAEHLERIWDRFYRVDASRTRATGGMGLGLAVVKRLIDAHDGWVDVTSTDSAGTTFRAAIPIGDGSFDS